MSIVGVDCANLEKNPECAHGPTLKFSRLVKGVVKTFYACSAYRDRKDCPFFLYVDEKFTLSKQVALEEWKKKAFPVIEYDLIIERLNRFKNLKSKQKHFCQSCFNYVFPQEYNEHKKHLLISITDNDLKCPSKILFPLTKNKSEAQYWFSEKTVSFFLSNIKKIKVNKVLCMGAPTIHEHLSIAGIETVLLDIDHRYHWFYEEKKFIWFNMFNFHYLGNKETSSSVLKHFLKDGNIAVIIDPPFGARTEPLSRTVKILTDLAPSRLNIFLVLPYFMEPQILSSFPYLTMLDFPVEYKNHKKFKDKIHSLKTSPVRIFTNVPPGEFVFPTNEGYHFCKLCQAWRSKLNKHCSMCGTCTSKNGTTYKHCLLCKTCVKNTWVHCNVCKKCVLQDHICKKKDNFPPNKKKKLKC